MLDINSALNAIFKNSNPDATDEEIQAKVEGLKKAGSSAVNQALSFIPGMNSVKDIATNAPALVNEVKDNPIVKGLAGEPLAPGIPNPGNPVSDIAQGALVNMLPKPETPPSSGVTGDFAPPMPLPEPPKADLPPIPAASPIAATPSPKAQTAMDTLTADTSSNDYAARQEELDREKKKHALGVIPVALGGIADALGNAAVPFGGKGASGTAEKLAETNLESDKRNKEAFETKLKTDPNSDLSKSYRQMVLQIAPDLAKQPSFQNMSAQAIGDKLPLIDTMMKAQAQKDAKEIGLKQIKESRNISLGLKEEQQQDKLEHDYKQQLMSVRGDPNISGLEKQRDAAAQAYNLIKDSETKGGYNLSEPQLVELYGQLYMAMTGRGLTAEAQKSMDQATGKQKAAALATFIGMSPSATTQAIGDRLKHMTTTLGHQTQENLDKRMESRVLPPSRLDPKRADAIRQAGRGYSFQELMEKSEERKSGKPKLSKDSLGLF